MDQYLGSNVYELIPVRGVRSELGWVEGFFLDQPKSLGLGCRVECTPLIVVTISIRCCTLCGYPYRLDSSICCVLACGILVVLVANAVVSNA